MWFYVDKDRQQCGPISVDELKRLLSTGAINKRTHLWQEGRAEWSRLEELAGTLGIMLATPPPTPAATMVMKAGMLPQQQPSAAAQPAYAPPPSFSAPNSPPNFPGSSFPAPNHPPQGFPAPNQQPQVAQGYSPAPTYPNVHAPVTASGSAGAMKNFAIAFVGICIVGYYAYTNFGYLVPSVAEGMARASLLKVIDDLEPARREIAEVFASRQLCPGEEGKNIALKTSFPADVVQKISYGTIGDDECAVVADVPKDYRLKAIAGTHIVFKLRNGEWLCGMSADDKYRPKICTQIEAN